jgi:hypothetical protein
MAKLIDVVKIVGQSMVPRAGVEPARPFGRIFKSAASAIPPPRHVVRNSASTKPFACSLSWIPLFSLIQCGKDEELLYPAFRLTTVGFGIEVGRTPDENFQFWVREPFAESFKRSFIVINSGDGVSQLFAGISGTVFRQFKNDFKMFLIAERCSSPAVRQFELNLYLPNEWMLPLQVLYQPRNRAGVPCSAQMRNLALSQLFCGTFHTGF